MKQELKKLLKSTDVNLLKAERKERADLRSQMVGWLYPSILLDEEAAITNRIKELQDGQGSSAKANR
jgi:hypothetical protein